MNLRTLNIPVAALMMRIIVTVTIIFLWNIHMLLAQTVSAGSMKIYITWIRIKAEKEKKRELNFCTNGSTGLLQSNYKKPAYLNNIFPVSETNGGSTSLVQIRNSQGSGNDAPADDFMLNLYPGMRGDNSGYMNSGLAGSQDLQSLAINGIAVAAGAIIMAALGTTAGNTDIQVSKAHVHKKVAPPDTDIENRDSPSMSGTQFKKNLVGFSFTPLSDTLTDIDGNIYHTAALGAMVIMTENLRTTRFHSGKEILSVKDSADLCIATVPAYSRYSSDSGISTVKGSLYNRDAICDTSGICPKNWHIPKYREWSSMINCLGGTNKAAGKLAEVFPVGKKTGIWWVTGGQDTSREQSLYLDMNTMEVKLEETAGNSGLLVRCIRNY
jgi:hypothetical protein